MPVKYPQTIWRPKRGRVLDKLGLLRQSGVDFIPISGLGQTIRTTPLIEDQTVTWREQYVKAALAYITNPLVYAAQSILNDEMADARITVEEKVNGRWVEDDNNELIHWLEHPNPTMDAKEFIRAYSTHLHLFGSVQAVMFQKGDILPNGKINLEDNCFDIIFPTRLQEDRVSDAYKNLWYYFPVNYENNPMLLNNDAMFMDVIYNPLAHSIGVSIPNNPLELILDIHDTYMKAIRRLLKSGATPTHLLTRKVDMQKEPTIQLDDKDVEEALQRVYAQVGQAGRRPDGWLGLAGDWNVKKMGSSLPELFNKDLLQYIETNVSAVWKIPPSIFWAGLSASNQRASRQMDSIDFFNQKIHPLLERIEQRLSKFLVPMFLGEANKRKFRIHFNVDNMPLAQYVKDKKNAQFEQWWKLRLLTFEETRIKLNLPTDGFEAEQLNEFYSGGNQGLSNEVEGETRIPRNTDNGLE